MEVATKAIKDTRQLLTTSAGMMIDWINTAPCQYWAIQEQVPQGFHRSTYPVCDNTWKDSHRQRLEHLKYPPHRTTIVHQRKTRGLINAGGELAKWLFGTATQGDMDKIMSLLRKTRGENKAVAHDVEALASVVDHTLTDIHDTKKGLRHSLAILKRLQNEVDGIMTRNQLMDGVKKADYYVAALLDLSRELDITELHHTNAVQDLRAGRVNAAILPPTVLEEIEHEVNQMGYKVSPHSWFLQHGQLEFLGQSADELIYKVNVPIFEATPYILYSIATHPVWINDSIVQIRARPEVLYDTTGGQGAAHPKNCVGRHPVVCEPVPREDTTRFECEYAMISNHIPELSKCEVTQEDPPAQTLFVDRFIWMKEQNLRLSCSDQQVQLLSVIDGIYEVTVPSHCTLLGSDWMLKGTFLETKNVTLAEDVSFQDVVLPPIMPLLDLHDSDDSPSPDLKTYGLNTYEADELPSEFHDELLRIKDNMNSIVNDMDTETNAWEMSGHDYWQTVTIVIIIIVLIIIFACIYKHRKNIYFLLFDKPWPYSTAAQNQKKIEEPNLTTPIELEDVV